MTLLFLSVGVSYLSSPSHAEALQDPGLLTPHHDALQFLSYVPGGPEALRTQKMCLAMRTH